jgi:hypothetical protein
MVTSKLKELDSWLGAFETFMMSFDTLKHSPTFIRIMTPLIGSPLYDKSPLYSLPIVDIRRGDTEEERASKKEKNRVTREERDRLTNLEIERVMPDIKKIATSQRCKIKRDRTSVILSK